MMHVAILYSPGVAATSRHRSDMSDLECIENNI